MAPDDAVRYSLHRRLEELVGPQEAALLMTGVPPFPWSEVATKRDLDRLRSELLARIDSIRDALGEVRGELGEVRGELGEVRGEVRGVRGEVRGVRGELREVRGELREVRGELLERIGRVEGRLGALRWQLFAASFVSSFTTAGLVLAVLRLA